MIGAVVDGYGGRWRRAEQAVERHGDQGAECWSEPVDPEVVPGGGGDGGAEGAGGIHRGAGDTAGEGGFEADDPAGGRGDHWEGSACLDGRGEDSVHEHEGQDDLKPERLPDIARWECRAEMAGLAREQSPERGGGEQGSGELRDDVGGENARGSGLPPSGRG